MPTKLRVLNADTPDKVIAMIESLPAKVEIKSIVQGKDLHWYVWFTILDTMDFVTPKQKKVKA